MIYDVLVMTSFKAALYIIRHVSEGYRVGSMFAGVGGIDIGFIDAGASIVWANEIDPNACMTYRANFGTDALVEADIHSIDETSVPDIDILIGGFPCQAFSVAGYRKGFEDDRGVLFLEIMRVIREKRPRCVFLENVKNLQGHDGGRTYKVIKESLESEGYRVTEKVLNTMDYGGIPQNRERIYIVAFHVSDDGSCPEMDSFEFPDPVPLNLGIWDILDYSDKKPEKYYYKKEHKYYPLLDETMKNSDTVYQWRRVYVRENKSNVCPTLTANMGGGGHNVPIVRDAFDIRKFTPRECFLFQGFPESFILPDMADSHLYKQAGNSVSVPVISRIAQRIVAAMESADDYNLM